LAAFSYSYLTWYFGGYWLSGYT